jgi:hypothetical protein
MHSASYDPSVDVTGKRVALVGGGSSAIQILPQIQKKASRVIQFMKGRTWIPPMGFGANSLDLQGGKRKFLAKLHSCNHSIFDLPLTYGSLGRGDATRASGEVQG